MKPTNHLSGITVERGSSSYAKALRKRNRKFFKKSLALGHINRAAKTPIKRKWDS